MKKKIIHISGLLILLLPLLWGCNKCYDCFTVPEPFFFNVVDSATGRNLFSDSVFLPQDIHVFLLPDSTGKYFSFLSGTKKDLIVLQFSNQKSQTVECVVEVGKQPLFVLHFYLEQQHNNCCTFTRYDSIQIKNAQSTYDSMNGIYTVFVTPDTSLQSH